MRLAVAAALLVAATPALAGYDKTTWGMPLEQIQKLYPGGFVSRPESAGTVTYVFETRVAGTHRAFVLFRLGSNDRLWDVTILLAAQEGSFDPVHEKVSPMTETEALLVGADIKGALSRKYGDGKRRLLVSGWEHHEWPVGKDTTATLFISWLTSSVEKPHVAIAYSKAEPADSTNGL